jgi:hypothetical protein
MEAAAPAKIGRLWWRFWPGKGEGLTYCRFVAADGRRSTGSWPTGGAQGARPQRCSAPASSRPRMRLGRHREVVGGLGRLREASACGGIGRKGRLPDGAHWQGRQALRLAW